MTSTAQPLVDYSRTEQAGFPRNSVVRLKLMIIGAGALGNEAAKALGLLGCGEVVIVDHDTVESHNLTRSVLFRTEGAVGRSKAASLADACRHYFPDTVWTALETEVTGIGLQWIARSDLVFSCVDNDLARLEIAWLCAKFDRPLVDAGLGGEDHSKCRVSLFPGRAAASFCCLLPPDRRRELLTFWDCQAEPCRFAPERETAFPGTPMAAAVGGSLQVDVGLRYLLKPPPANPPIAARSIEIVLDPPQLTSFCISRNPGCPFHGDLVEGCVFEAADSDMTVNELMHRARTKRIGEPSLVLDWPLCLLAKCRDCGARWEPMTRVALFRRSAVCPSCGSGRPVAVRVVHRISSESPLADRSLRDLGMPDRHIYTIEFPAGNGGARRGSTPIETASRALSSEADGFWGRGDASQ